MLRPRRRPFAPVILAVALFCASGGAARAAQESFTGVVTHVADGDTLDVTTGQRTVTIRLEGIDAPERGQPYGGQARNFLRVLAFSQPVTVRVKQTDRYGRLVARVIVAGRDVSEEMVRAGLAWHYLDYSSDPRLAALEKDARARRVGLWADRSPVPPWVARRPGAARTTPAAGSVRTPPRPRTPPQADRSYHGNVKSHVYHAPGCRDYTCPNCTQVFTTRQQADAAGYRPHAECVGRAKQ
ncbi:MAG: thermonuclease family protein [Bacteroidales bacterium]